MVSVTTGLAVAVCVSPGPVRKAILGNSVTRHPRTVAQVGCPSTATRTLSAASMTQQGQSFWHGHSGGHIVIVQAHSSCEAASPLIMYIRLCTCCTGLFEQCSQPARNQSQVLACLRGSNCLLALCWLSEGAALSVSLLCLYV